MSATCESLVDYHTCIISAITRQDNPNILLVGANPTDYGHQNMISFLKCNFPDRFVSLYTASHDNSTGIDDNHINLDLNSSESVTRAITKYKDFFTLIVVDICVLCHLKHIDIPNFYKLFNSMIITGGILVAEAPSFSDTSIKTKILRDQIKDDGFVLSDNGLVMIYKDSIVYSVPEINFYLTYYEEYITKCMDQVYSGGGLGLFEEISTYVSNFDSVYPLRKFHIEAQNLFVNDLKGCYSQIHFSSKWIFSPTDNVISSIGSPQIYIICQK